MEKNLKLIQLNKQEMGVAKGGQQESAAFSAGICHACWFCIGAGGTPRFYKKAHDHRR